MRQRFDLMRNLKKIYKILGTKQAYPKRYFSRPPVVFPFHQLLERQSGVTSQDAETRGVGERGGGRARPRRGRLGVRRGEHQVQGKLRNPSSLPFEFEFCSGLTVCTWFDFDPSIDRPRRLS
jgi:hypothetical protein